MQAGLRIKGHPVHPMLIAFPITLYVLTLLGDLTYLATSNLFWYQGAYICLGLSLIFGLLAAGAGVFELFTTEPRSPARSTGWLHGGLNLGIWALFAANFAIRSRDGLAIPDSPLTGSTLYAVVLLSFLGSGLLIVAGWLGWDLVYRHGVGLAPLAAQKIQPGGQPGTHVEPIRPQPESEERPPASRDDLH